MSQWSDDLTGRVVAKLHPDPPTCPLCGSGITHRMADWRNWECGGCGCEFVEPEDEDVCGLCGVRRVRPGFTACSTCG